MIDEADRGVVPCAAAKCVIARQIRPGPAAGAFAGQRDRQVVPIPVRGPFRVGVTHPLAPLLMLPPRERDCPRRKLAGHHSLDQPGVDQQPVEAPRLRAAGAGVKKALAALENSLLLGERGIERQAGRLLHDERQIRSLDRVERLRGRVPSGHPGR